MAGYTFDPNRDEQHDGPSLSAGPEHMPATPRTGLVLIVSAETTWRREMTDRLAGLGFGSSEAASGRDAERVLKQSPHDLVLVDARLPRGSAFTLCTRLSQDPGQPGSVVLEESPSVDSAVRAMRAGASDLITGNPGDDELRERLGAAVERSREGVRRANRADRLETLCTKLEGAHDAVAGQVGGLCDDLVGAYQDLTDRMGDLSVASELNSLLRQELDVESLLRTTLEYLLAKVGSTNAGIFLPSPSGEWTLGAYINYDCPKDSAEVMLDQLADVVAPRFEEQRTLLHIKTDAEFASHLDNDAHWMDKRSMLVIACHDQQDDGAEEECLAVVTLFRNRTVGFNSETERLVEIVCTMFSRQLDRVIRTHYRHKPKDQWGLDDWQVGDDDLAA